MLALTSISPKHISDNQQRAVKSWEKFTDKTYSFNHPSELSDELKLFFPATFIPTHRTMEHWWGKPLVIVNALIDFAKESRQDCIIINSDIELKMQQEHWQKILDKSNDGIVILRRRDHAGDYQGRRYDFGFDAFIIRHKFLEHFPQSIFAIGQTWWDYWLPFTAIRKTIPIFEYNAPAAWHIAHNAQYSADHWKKLSTYFIWEFNLPLRPPQTINNIIYGQICAKMQPFS